MSDNSKATLIPPLVARTSIPLWGTMFVISLVFVMIVGRSVVAYHIQHVVPNYRSGIVGAYEITGLALFWATYSLYQLSQARPQLIIAPEGLLWRKWSNSVIPWSAFSEGKVEKKSGSRYLCFTLCDPAVFPPTRFFGWGAPAVIRVYTGPLDVSFTEVIDAIRSVQPHLLPE